MQFLFETHGGTLLSSSLVQWHKYTCIFIRISSVSSANSLPACSPDLFFKWVVEAKEMFSVKFSVLCELNWSFSESRQHSWLTIRKFLGHTWCRTWLKMLWGTLSAHPSCPSSKALSWFLIKRWLVFICPSDNLLTRFCPGVACLTTTRPKTTSTPLLHTAPGYVTKTSCALSGYWVKGHDYNKQSPIESVLILSCCRFSLQPFCSLIQIHGHNRARQRDKLGHILEEFATLQDEVNCSHRCQQRQLQSGCCNSEMTAWLPSVSSFHRQKRWTQRCIAYWWNLSPNDSI